MNMFVYPAALWILVLASLETKGDTIMTIKPQGPVYVQESSKMQLDCTYKGDNAYSFKWTKDNMDVSEEEFTVSTFRTITPLDGKLLSILSLHRNDMRMRDTGVYACSTLTHRESVRVKVLRVTTEGNDEVTDSGENIRLKCDPATSDVQVSWTKNNIPLTQLKDLSGRYTLEDRNTTLVIRNTSLSDSGAYVCVIKPLNGVTQDNISVQVVLRGSPYFLDGHNQTITQTLESSTLELSCPARGYPIPSVVWTVDGNPLNVTTGVQLLPYDGVKAALLRIENYSSQFGEEFMCEAVNEQGRTLRHFQVVYSAKLSSYSVLLSSTFAIVLSTLLSVILTLND